MLTSDIPDSEVFGSPSFYRKLARQTRDQARADRNPEGKRELRHAAARYDELAMRAAKIAKRHSQGIYF